MTLDEVVRANERYGAIESIASALKEDSSAPEAYDGLRDYLVDYLGMIPADAAILVESDRMTEKRARAYARLYSRNDKNDLVSKVEANYDLVLNAIKGERLNAFAISLPEKDKKYLIVDQALKAKDYNIVKAVLIDKYDLDIWRDFVVNGGEELNRAFGNIYVQTEQRKFVENKLSDVVKTAKGKPDYKINPAKVKNYITDTLKKYKPKQKNEWYARLAGQLG